MTLKWKNCQTKMSKLSPCEQREWGGSKLDWNKIHTPTYIVGCRGVVLVLSQFKIHQHMKSWDHLANDCTNIYQIELSYHEKSARKSLSQISVLHNFKSFSSRLDGPIGAIKTRFKGLLLEILKFPGLEKKCIDWLHKNGLD